MLLNSLAPASKRARPLSKWSSLFAILPPESDGPLSLLELSRGHWGIENCLHYVRDVTFAEDRSRLRTGHAPQLLAACRNLVITLIHRSGSSHIASSRRSF